MKRLQEDLRETIFKIIGDMYPVIPDDIIFSIPPKRDYGDLSTTIPFVIAKKTGEKPFVIGRELSELLKNSKGIFSDVSIQGGGFLNFFLDHDLFFEYMFENIESNPKKKNKKIVVEHTSINPNKSAHIGHLRNACIGDTLARGLGFLGYKVEVQNYLDDTGIQVADVIWGLLKHDGKNLDKVKEIDEISSYLWKKYPEYSSLLNDKEELRIERDLVHKQIEDKSDPFYSAGEYISRSVVKNHISVMDSIDIRYDVLIRERDIIELDFFQEAARILEVSGIMYDSEDPGKKNCKVIKYKKENIEKIVVRSNGTITYIGKDIAYALWKVGLIKNDFFFKKFYTYSDGRKIFISSFIPGNKKFDFGRADRIITVIDVRQSYLQSIISDEIINVLGVEKGKKEYVHFSYEMVALTPGCVQDMGFELNEEEKKRSYIEVSGRKGVAVSADDLMDKLLEKSLEEIKKRNPEMGGKTLNSIAGKIAVGALRYFMLRFNSNTVISFDFADALSFEGDTGPYIQYTMVRINSILKKTGFAEQSFRDEPQKISGLGKDEEALIFEMLLKLSLNELQVEMSLEKRELSFITTHTYSICQLFNHYYHKYPVMSEKDENVKTVRIKFLMMIKSGLESLLNILGIPVPERM